MDENGGKELARLTAPERNNYFYGKLLDDAHLRMEQSYFNRKRWLLNRLELGTGVLCGLSVGESNGVIVVSSGVAIDAFGREIIVPADVRVDPWVAFDDAGNRTDLPRDVPQSLWLCLSYIECDTELVPVLVADCDSRGGAAASTVVESYRLTMRTGTPPALPVRPRSALCAALKDGKDAAERVRALCGVSLDDDCAVQGGACVTLARITTADGKVTSIDRCTDRQVVYGNAALFEMILCLAARIEECCGGTTPTPDPTPDPHRTRHPDPTPDPVPVPVLSLSYVAGNNQVAAPGATLPAPLVVLVQDGGVPRAGETVTFVVKTGGGAVGGGGGTLGPQFTAVSDATGQATLPRWRLGGAAGTNLVAAQIASGTPDTVGFVAVARPADDRPLLRVVAVEFLDTNDRPVGKVGGDPLEAALQARTKPSQIRFTFNVPPLAASLTTFPGGAADPSKASVIVERAVVVRAGSNAVLPGRITIDPARPEVAVWSPRKRSISFAEGAYRCTLMSDPGRPSVTEPDGTLLDGEPVQLPSGDGVRGGPFQFRFTVS